MQFFKKNQKRIVIFFLFAVLLVGVRLTIGKLQETIDNSPEANVRITSTGIDVENHQLLLDAAVPLKGWKKPALLLKTSCCSTGNRRYSVGSALPLYLLCEPNALFIPRRTPFRQP